VVKKLNFILLLGLVFFISCFHGNEIYYDIKEQSIKSCNQKGIMNLYIENLKTSDMYKFEFNDTMKNQIPNVVYVDSISNQYTIYKGWQKKITENSKFKLTPLSQYTIERVQGDASSYKIEVWTDSNGRVIRSSKEKCSN
jgi:hypothetical protein